MEHTANYQLSQWEKTDRIMMEDFNGDNAKLESALTALAAKDAALQQGITAQANRVTQKLYTTTRVGTDSSGNPSISFPARPLVVMICGSTEFLISLPASGRAYGKLNSGTTSFNYCTCSVSGSRFTWDSGLCDQQGVTYQVFAVLAG